MTLSIVTLNVSIVTHEMRTVKLEGEDVLNGKFEAEVNVPLAVPRFSISCRAYSSEALETGDYIDMYGNAWRGSGHYFYLTMLKNENTFNFASDQKIALVGKRFKEGSDEQVD